MAAMEDVVAVRRIRDDEYAEVRGWCSFARSMLRDDRDPSQRRIVWLAFDASGEPVAAVAAYWLGYSEEYQLEFVVKPARRCRGFGREAMRAICHEEPLASSDLVAQVVPLENEASARCFAAAGFSEGDDAGVWWREPLDAEMGEQTARS